LPVLSPICSNSNSTLQQKQQRDTQRRTHTYTHQSTQTQFLPSTTSQKIEQQWSTTNSYAPPAFPPFPLPLSLSLSLSRETQKANSLVNISNSH
jgi:hypothetical protein